MNTEIENKVETNNRLPRRFKNKLIRALRSGRYVQTVGKMKEREEDRYDVIGVAYRQAGVPKQSITKMGIPNGKQYNFLPKVLTDANSTVVEKLKSFNDKELSFRWIASYMEDHM